MAATIQWRILNCRIQEPANRSPSSDTLHRGSGLFCHSSKRTASHGSLSPSMPARRCHTPGELQRTLPHGRTDECQRPAAVDRRSLRLGAQGGYRRHSGHRPLSRRPVAGAALGGRSRATRLRKSAGERRSSTMARPQDWLGDFPARRPCFSGMGDLSILPGATRLMATIAQQPDVRLRPASRNAVPRRDDARDDRDLVRKLGGRGRGLSALPPPVQTPQQMQG